MEYKDWRNFQKVIDKAVLSANNSVSNKEDWAVEVNKPIKTGKGKEEYIKDSKDKHKFLIDKNVSHIIKKIFNMILLGKSRKEIAEF